MRLTSSRTGSVWSEQDKLLASNGVAGDEFGSSVGLDGDSAIVGAWRADQFRCPDFGAAYVFHRSGSAWSQSQRIVASDAAGSDAFGDAVSISGTLAIAGAVGDDDAGTNSGSAYVYDVAAMPSVPAISHPAALLTLVALLVGTGFASRRLGRADRGVVG